MGSPSSTTSTRRSPDSIFETNDCGRWSFCATSLIAAVPLLHWLLLSILYDRLLTVIVMTVLLAVWTSIHRVRRQSWAELHLKYEELPDPAVYGLNLLR